MRVVETIAALRSELGTARGEGAVVGLVPTMGYLHEGHATLIRRAASECGFVVMTSFVNPLQFGAGEDLDAYPRDPDGDERVATDAGADLIFRPSVEEMYPRPMLTTVSVAGLPTVMEGASRPTHFDGVTTVVAKLFSMVGECHAYFGEKDFQQLAVVRRMVDDLSMPVRIVACPTSREPDGLARSSRNAYLTADERTAAPVLNRALRTGAAAIVGGEADAAAVRALMADVVGAERLAALDYVEVADPDTLEPLDRCDDTARLFGAVRFGRARLIDNIAVHHDLQVTDPESPAVTDELDVLIIGSGVAGLSAAVRAASTLGLRVGVLSKAELSLATTRWAQGGVAAALSGDPEEIDLHLADTLAAGAGLCDLDAVRVLVDEGPSRVHDLIALGARFDHDHEGRLELAREGGHSVPRVIHAGGAATGAEIERALVEAVRRTAAVLHEGAFALGLIVEGGRCCGVRALDAHGGPIEVRARHTVLATGGAGQLFAVTTNPTVATGDGVAMALTAGAAIADLEFFQFHPTALAHPSMPRPLLSEALRGHGALLRDSHGERFVDELLPRDVVSRAITAVLLDQHVDHVWLDATGLDHFGERFPTIAADLAAVGLDPATDLLPVAPAAHHQCGGIVTDLDGATTVRGLWACGETSCSGVHGANRLASNSLLEGMVFGARVVEAIASGVDEAGATGAMRAALGKPSDGMVIGGRHIPLPEAIAGAGTGRPLDPADVAEERTRLQRVMTTHAGVLRSAASLGDAIDVLAEMRTRIAPDPVDPATCELSNLVDIGLTLLAAALERTESRGAHARTDHPTTEDELRCRLVVGRS